LLSVESLRLEPGAWPKIGTTTTRLPS